MSEWWTQARQVVAALVDRHGLLAAALFLFVDEAGAPTPVPGNALIVALGIRVQQGLLTAWRVVAALEVATVAGATILYALSNWAGRRLVYRYGRYIGVTGERLGRAERWVRRHGFLAVFLARLVPGFRIVTAAAAGLLSVPLVVFLPAMSLGALLYIVACVVLGYWVGPPVLTFLEQIRWPLSAP